MRFVLHCLIYKVQARPRGGRSVYHIRKNFVNTFFEVLRYFQALLTTQPVVLFLVGFGRQKAAADHTSEHLTKNARKGVFYWTILEP